MASLSTFSYLPKSNTCWSITTFKGSSSSRRTQVYTINPICIYINEFIRNRNMGQSGEMGLQVQRGISNPKLKSVFQQKQGNFGRFSVFQIRLTPFGRFWQKRLLLLKDILRLRRKECFIAQSADQFLSQLFPPTVEGQTKLFVSYHEETLKAIMDSVPQWNSLGSNTGMCYYP